MRSAVSMAVLRQLLGCHPQSLLELSHFLDQLTPAGVFGSSDHALALTSTNGPTTAGTLPLFYG